MNEIAARLAAVQERIAQAARRAGRRPEAITLVAVTKSWPLEVLLAAYDAGMRAFGENRPEELAQKRPALTAALGRESGVVWHAIGRAQSRKTGLVAAHADYFHALDRLKIARRLSAALAPQGRTLPVLLEVNISGEASKGGYAASRWEEDAAQREALCQEAAAIARLPGLALRGLMTIAPWNAPEADIRLVFRRARLLAEWLQAAVPQARWSELSMGMTDDFEWAIEEGATLVRIGRAIFGERG